MSNDFQTIVIGGGSIGSAAAYWLAKRGQRDVLLLEQHELGHALGSSGDHSRIIRHSYHDNAYGRLTRAMYDNWARLDAETAQPVFVRTGGIDIAPEGTPGTASVDTYRSVMAANNIPFETLDRSELVARFPQWEAVTGEVRATYQSDTGLIDVRRAVMTHVALAEGLGVQVRDRTAVRSIEPFGSASEHGSSADARSGGVRVVTDDATYTADHVVVAAGSWSDALLRPLGQGWSTTITEEQVVYLRTPNLRDFAVGTFPTWIWHADVPYYGFPVYGEVAIKLARENLSRVVTQATRSLTPHADETEALVEFVRERLPGALGPVLAAKTCPYDLPPDRHFILDHLPGQSRVVVASGAAHAGKFSGLLGEIASELVVHGRSSLPIEAFRADRPALRDGAAPSFSLTT